MKQQYTQQRSITLLGKRINAQQLQQLINNTLEPAITIHNQVHNALQHGINEKTAYNIPQEQLALLRRYQRALQLYDEYKQYYEQPRADYILTPAKPSHKPHIAHFICGTTSDKYEQIYTKYRVTLVKRKKTLHIVCDCPDYTNRGGSFPCKHTMLACMWLRDYAEGMYR